MQSTRTFINHLKCLHSAFLGLKLAIPLRIQLSDEPDDLTRNLRGNSKLFIVGTVNVESHLSGVSVKKHRVDSTSFGAIIVDGAQLAIVEDTS